MTTRNCENCGVAYGPDDLFCENCGYDFVTGSLPTEADGAPPASPTSATSGITASALPEAPSVLDEAVESSGSGPAVAVEVPRVTVTVAVDEAFFAEVVNEGEIDFPDPIPADQELSLAGTEFHIGRTSESRAIHPDIDVADLTNDQAVSSRHAVLRVANDGTLTIVDVGSTNGTFLGTVDAEALTHGIPFEVKPGSPIYVGAWTRLVVSE
ncbi:MAG: FHA domain-containing protein [Actinomycetota bacterium]